MSINVEDVDLDNERVRVRSKGGDIDWLHFPTGSARLLPRLIGRRIGGPLFLMLMAKSRHASLRSLQRYARPGAEAVAGDDRGHRPGAPTQLDPLE